MMLVCMKCVCGIVCYGTHTCAGNFTDHCQHLTRSLEERTVSAEAESELCKLVKLVWDYQVK